MRPSPSPCNIPHTWTRGTGADAARSHFTLTGRQTYATEVHLEPSREMILTPLQ